MAVNRVLTFTVFATAALFPQAAPSPNSDIQTHWQPIGQLCGQLELAAPKKKHIIVNGKSEERLYTAYLEGAAVALYLGKSTEEGCCAAHISMAHSRFEGVQPGAYWLRVQKNQLIRLIPVRVTNEFRALKISPASAANRGAHHPRLISPTSLVPIWQIVLVHMSLSS